jgi:photosystem II stability/assembly factor-like uncharacterized protein
MIVVFAGNFSLSFGQAWHHLDFNYSLLNAPPIFLNADTGWIGYEKTTDGGVAWADDTISPSFYQNGVLTAFKESSVRGSLALYVSSDGGNNWSIRGAIAATQMTVFYFSGDTVLCAGFAGGCANNTWQYFSSYDGGTTWKGVQNVIPGIAGCLLESISFRDANNGIAVTAGLDTEENEWFVPQITHDGGLTWNQIGVIGQPISIIWLYGKTWLAANGYLSQDDGIRWKKISNVNLDLLAKAGSHDVYSIADSFLYHSGDDGATWETESCDVQLSSSNVSFSFPTDSIGYAVVAPGTLLKISQAGLMGTASTAGVSKEPKIFPNPSTGRVSISGVEKVTSLHVYNLLGQDIYAQNPSPRATISMDLHALPEGTYLLRLTSPDKAETLQLVLER